MTQIFYWLRRTQIVIYNDNEGFFFFFCLTTVGIYFFFLYMNWKYKVTVNMPFDKNIFTKKCTFLYNSCQLHVSTSPMIPAIPTNCQYIISVLFLNLVKFFFQPIDTWNKHDKGLFTGQTKKRERWESQKCF